MLLHLPKIFVFPFSYSAPVIVGIEYTTKVPGKINAVQEYQVRHLMFGWNAPLPLTQ